MTVASLLPFLYLETEAQNTVPLVSRPEYVLWTCSILLHLLAHAVDESCSVSDCSGKGEACLRDALSSSLA